MRPVGSIVVLALKQLSSARGLGAVLGLGIVIAATLLASAPIYARAMADLGLTFTIQNDLQGRATSRVEFADIALQAPEGDELRETVERRITERIGWFTESTQRSVRLGRFAVSKEGEELKNSPPNAEPVGFEELADHVVIVEGRLPERANSGVIEVAMSPDAARAGSLAVGDSIVLHQEFDNCEREIPGDGIPPPPPPCPITERVMFSLPAVVVGIVEPADEFDGFWPGTSSRYFRSYFLPLENVGPIFAVFARPEVLAEDFGAMYPFYRGYHTWSVQADTTKLNRTNFERARDDLVALYDEFEPLGGFAISPLRDTLISYGRTAEYQQVPLLVLLLEITAIALFYIIIVASIVVERQADEIGLLRGRGASIWQVLMMYLLQGLVIGIPALVLAPFIAGGLTAILGLTPLFEDVTGGELLPVTIVPMAFVTAALGIALSLAAILLPAFIAARKSATASRRAISRPGQSFFQRYYLDLLFAAAAGVLLFELNQRGSVFTPSSTGGVTSDPLLLAAPALAIAGAAALIVRFYPLILKGVSRLVRPVAGASVTLGLVQVVRNSGQYTRLALLLMMVVAVGTFAASYTATADQSYLDRANHEAGVDVRAYTINSSFLLGTDPDTFIENAEQLDGVTQTSTVVRNSASIATTGSNTSSFQAIGMDPASSDGMLSFRPDLADQPLDELMTAIESPGDITGKPLPANAETVSMWMKTDQLLGGQTVRLGMRDSAGNFAMLPVTETEFIVTQWQQFTASIEDLPYTPVEPLMLVSVVLTGTSTRPGGPGLFVDDIVATSPAGELVIEDFEGPPLWSLFPTVAPLPDEFSVSTTAPHSGANSAEFRIKSNASDETRGFYLAGFLTPLPVIVSESFIDATGVGMNGQVLLKVATNFLVPAVVRGTFELFPTTSSTDGPVVIFNRDRLLVWTQIVNPGFGAPPEVNELWLSVTPETDLAELEQVLKAEPFKLERVITRAEILEENTRNPLIAASGTGILSLAFVAVLILAAAALLTSLLAAVRRRRVEFAVVQAIGLTKRQLLAMLALEYSIVFGLGVIAGAIMGLFVSDQMLSFLNVTESGDEIEPSFILETEWGYVLIGVALVLAVFSVALWLASRSVGRGAEAQALRTE